MNGPATDERTPAERVRGDFPATERWAYLDVSARGILSRSVRNAIDGYLDDALYNGGDKDRWFAMIETVRAKFARLIGAKADEVSFTKNVSEGLNVIANAVPLTAGDNVVLCADVEHPNNVYTWLNLRPRGVEVRLVPSALGAIDQSRLLAAIDGRTRIVTLSAASFAPGYRADLRAIGEACRAAGVFFMVDAAQSVGILHTDVERDLIDGLAVSTHKGLLAMYGMGFLYCRAEWAERLRPAYLARFGIDVGAAHEADMGSLEYRLLPGARRFDLGNYNYAAAFAVDASLDMLLDIGTQAIERHVLGLAATLRGELAQCGLDVATVQAPEHASHIVCVGAWDPRRHDGSHDRDLTRLHRRLTDGGVRSTMRRGMVRFSLHLYNDSSDVDRVLALASDDRDVGRTGYG